MSWVFLSRLINTTPSTQKSLILTQWLSFCDKAISAKYPALKIHRAEFYNRRLLERKSGAAAHGPQYPAGRVPVLLFVRVNVISGFYIFRSMCAPYCALTPARHQGAGCSSRAADIEFVYIIYIALHNVLRTQPGGGGGWGDVPDPDPPLVNLHKIEQSHRGARCCRGVRRPLLPPATLLVRAHSYRGYRQLPNTGADTTSAE